MLQFMGSQRVGHDRVTEQQIRKTLTLLEMKPDLRRKTAEEAEEGWRRGRGWVHSQREPVSHCVDSMEAAPVQRPVYRIVADLGQRFQGTGRERRG